MSQSLRRTADKWTACPVRQIIGKLGEVKTPYKDKESLVAHLIQEKKIPRTIAHWLMTSLKRTPDGKGEKATKCMIFMTLDSYCLLSSVTFFAFVLTIDWVAVQASTGRSPSP
jgi:hypothetical protein